MKIEFTNEDCTKASVTRGVWFWKKRAEVFRSRENQQDWYYLRTRVWVGLDLNRALQHAREFDAPWDTIAGLPGARLLSERNK